MENSKINLFAEDAAQLQFEVNQIEKRLSLTFFVFDGYIKVRTSSLLAPDIRTEDGEKNHIIFLHAASIFGPRFFFRNGSGMFLGFVIRSLNLNI